MRQFPKRASLSLLGGLLIQFVFFLVAAVLGSPMLALVLLLPGWALVYAGRSSDPVWGLPVMVLINAVIYAPLVYLLLYWRPFKRKEILSIRAE
jgi:predicted benzoate:H+ symporter BenE